MPLQTRQHKKQMHGTAYDAFLQKMSLKGIEKASNARADLARGIKRKLQHVTPVVEGDEHSERVAALQFKSSTSFMNIDNDADHSKCPLSIVPLQDLTRELRNVIKSEDVMVSDARRKQNMLTHGITLLDEQMPPLLTSHDAYLALFTEQFRDTYGHTLHDVADSYQRFSALLADISCTLRTLAYVEP